MLELKKITKIYETEGFKQTALDEVSINFRKCEFASILGPSGSGKTTLLNIIGGLDHYTSGDLKINEISTKKYKDSDWDSYRNHRIGFVFQNYNLITHQTILSNVVLALTLSGISKKEGIKRAKKALKDVGLEDHINKKPNQLSGGQMQRVAIARALVNDPEILLADEPTGALDSDTSVQIMDLLKKIAKDKLVIMVTHNPELAEKYSSRIISLKDGHVTSDTNPYDGKVNTKEKDEININKSKKTKMSFKTALGLSFNNLMTKKGRTILVAFAGSIGIIGIALILALSTGFQNYVDSISEDTLSSYPLTIMESSADITSTLLSLTTGSGENDESETVKEEQYISKMFSSISTNDLKSFKNYLEDNYDEVKNDLANVKYTYSIDPLIYTIDNTNTLTKVNPNNLFSSTMGSSMLSSYSSMASIYSQMTDDKEAVLSSYDILKGRLPEKYDEAIIVLSEPNTISDLLLYSLGKKDNKELTKMMSIIMSGEGKVEVSDPLTLSYDDLLSTDLRVILPTNLYKYNSKYKVYEDMSSDASYMKDLYNKSIKLKIVGIVSSKEGSSSMALSPGINYTSDLIKYIINESSKTDIVKKQIQNPDIDIFSGSKFDKKTNKLDINFSDLITVDSKKMKDAFGINLTQKDIANMTSTYMLDIQKSISADTTTAKNDYKNLLDSLTSDLYSSLSGNFSLNDVDTLVDNFLTAKEVEIINLNNKYGFIKENLKSSYAGLLKEFLNLYINNYYELDNSLTTALPNKVAQKNNTVLSNTKNDFNNKVEVIGTINTMASYLKEASMSSTILTKVGELSEKLITSVATSFKVDEAKIASAFTFNLTEEEVTRIITAMNNNEEKANSKTNLISLGYQDLDEPTFISFYFNSFDGKEHFMSFLDNYNEYATEEKRINYSDTTGILMGSVKTIVNAVSYVLIAFVSVSLVVSSIMIGIITYISVYERTKEIGILRAIGASKHNISSIFNAETFIVGLLSGLIGIGITYTLIPIINAIIHSFTGNIPLSATLNIMDGIKLIILSVILTLIGGLIPSKAASKKDPVEALRSE